MCNRKETQGLLENATNLSCQEFESKVGNLTFKEIGNALGYSKGFQMKEDFCVQYYASVNPSGEAMFFTLHYGTAYVQSMDLGITA